MKKFSRIAAMAALPLAAAAALSISAEGVSAQTTLENTLQQIRSNKSLSGDDLKKAAARREASYKRINELAAELARLKGAEKAAVSVKPPAAEKPAPAPAPAEKTYAHGMDKTFETMVVQRSPSGGAAGVRAFDTAPVDLSTLDLGPDTISQSAAEKIAAADAGTASVQALRRPGVTLDECIANAAANNPSILESEFNLRAYRDRVDQAKAPMQAQVNASGSGTWSESRTDNNVTTSTSKASSNNLSVTATQVVYDGGKLAAGLEISRKNLLAAELGHKKLLLDTYLKVAENYFNTIMSIRLETLQRENFRSAVMHEELAEANFKVGVSPKTDLIRAEANTYQIKYDLIAAKNTIKKNKLALALSMGLIDSEEIWLRDSLESDTFAIDLKASIEKAVNARQEVLAEREAIAILEAQKRQIRAERAPQFSVGSNAGRSFDNSSKAERNSYSVYGSLSYAIYNGGLTSAKLADIDNRVKAEERKLESLVMSIKYDVTQAYLNLMEALEKIEVARKNVESAELSKKLTEEQYKVGLATMIDLLDSEVSYSRAMTNLIQAQGSFHIARCRFGRSVGDGEFYK